MARPVRTRSRSWLVGALAMASWLIVGAFTFATRVEATTCGQISIERGSVTPGAGTTTTNFVFTVTVSDRTGAKPSDVTVRVAGAFKPMTTTDTDVRAGLVYRLSTKLPAGNYSYWFRAHSAKGITCDLTLVDPATITITAPTPTPKPTAKPTPTPTPQPTAKPTPKPTPKPNAKTTPKPTATTTKGTPAPSAPTRPMPDASESPAATEGGASPTPVPTASEPGSSPIASVEPSPTVSPSPTPVPVVVSGGSTGDGGVPNGLGGSGPGLAGPILIWLLTSAGGIWLFLVLMRSSGDDASEGLLLVPAIGGVGATAPAATTPPVEPTPARPTGRATMLPPMAPRTFDDPPAKGVERARIGYRRVRISSKPDAIRSVERGRLERGDEVEILDSYEGYLEIRTPDGLTGWVLRHTIVG